MDIAKLSRSELDEALRTLTATSPAGQTVLEEVRLLVHDLQTHQCELEMQNAALRETQQKLEHAFHRYSDLYDSLPIGYLTLTLDGRILEANLAAVELLGWPRDRVEGAVLRQFLPAEEATALALHLEESARTPGRQKLEATVLSRGTAPLRVQLATDASAVEGVPVLRMAITDISELKLAQGALQHIVEEQETFAYSISHDLRAPLLTISSFANVLLEDGAERSPQEQVDILGRIRRAALRMDVLLQDLLDYSRVSRARVVPQTIEVGAVVAEVLAQHQAAITERKAQITAPTGNFHVIGARALLIQVLGNLLSNALKYSPRDRPPVVRIEAEERERTLVISVADQGIGIAPKYQERIFRIFERLHGQAEYPGTGVGLAVVRRAAERMMGRVWVESEEGKGSRFFVELPRADGGPIAAPPAVVAKPADKSTR